MLLRSLVPAASVDHVFICGPTGMSEDIEATCRDIGIAADRIHVERFVSEFGGKPRPKAVIAAGAPPKAMAALIIDGKRREVPVRRAKPFSMRRCAQASICRSPARAACARPAAPSSSRARRRWR